VASGMLGVATGIYAAFTGDVLGLLLGLPSLIFSAIEAPSVARGVFNLDDIHERQAEVRTQIEKLEREER
jgi:hypothetical protein